MPKLKEQLQQAMKQMSDFEKLKSHIEMTVTTEGLRIELSESASGTFFDSGSAKLKAMARSADHPGSGTRQTSQQALDRRSHRLSAVCPSATYGNWELSSDRANAARRVMQANGIRADQVTQVRGFADQRLRKPDAPLDPANRRISLIVQYILKNNDDEDANPRQPPLSQSRRNHQQPGSKE